MVAVDHRPIAVTGASGRLGSALVDRLRRNGTHVVEWRRPDYDIDDPTAGGHVVERDRPRLVYHAAAWTDVDGCARQPELAMRRNAEATRELVEACVRADVALVYVSTNEVFDGQRTDGRGYAEHDMPRPANAYGSSKLAGEEAVASASAAGHRGWIVRTSWIFGPPGSDFPTKILGAADARGDGARLPVVADETGRPTYARDLAAALVELPQRLEPGVVHLANDGRTSRLEWAAAVLSRCRPAIGVAPIKLDEFERPSRPPAWGVLDTSLAESLGLVLPPWEQSLDDYLSVLCAH